MRSIAQCAAAIIGAFLVCASALGQQSVTVKGITYVSAELVKEYPKSVQIRHATGIDFVNKADLTAEDAQTLGVISIKQAPEVSPDAMPSLASESVSKSEQFPTTSASVIRRASLQQVNTALASLDKRITEQGSVLKGLIPRTTHITDLCELWRDYHYGFLNPEIDAMARAHWDVLAKKKMLVGKGYDSAKAEDLSKHCSQLMSALIDEANLWIARRNELAKSQERASEAPRGGSAEMFRPVGSNMPSIESRRENVKNGRVPLSKSELDRFLSGKPLSPMASTSEKNAWIMTEVMLGRRPVKDMPDEYRVAGKVNSRQAARSQPPAAAARRSTSVPFEPSIFQAPNGISAAPAAPRFVNKYDSAGNFHTGVAQPTGFYDGTVHYRDGGVGHVTGHASPIGPFQGMDNHGGFYHGH